MADEIDIPPDRKVWLYLETISVDTELHLTAEDLITPGRTQHLLRLSIEAFSDPEEETIRHAEVPIFLHSTETFELFGFRHGSARRLFTRYYEHVTNLDAAQDQDDFLNIALRVVWDPDVPDATSARVREWADCARLLGMSDAYIRMLASRSMRRFRRMCTCKGFIERLMVADYRMLQSLELLLQEAAGERQERLRRQQRIREEIHGWMMESR